jgi:transposase InsO family protein
VILSLQYLFAVRGAPEHIRSDNGPEFVAKEIQKWLGRALVRTLYFQKASPRENGYVESFNGNLATTASLPNPRAHARHFRTFFFEQSQ